MPETDLSQGNPPSRRALQQRKQALRARRRRKIQALAAGGLVLGIGASVTIASWTDQEFGTGTFEAGSFEIEINTDGSWVNSESMQFEATNMFPGDRAYARVLARTTEPTTYDGALRVTGEGSSDTLTPHLAYRAIAANGLTIEESDNFSCGPDDFTSEPSEYVFGGPDTFLPMNTAHDENNTEEGIRIAGNGQDIAAYCFEVELAPDTPNSAQSSGANHQWTWEAESIVDD